MDTALPSYPPAPVPGVVPPRERSVRVVTHPEATHHVAGLVGGQFDSMLTPRGRVQAAAIARSLTRAIDPAMEVAVVTSDLARTTETAELIGRALNVAVRPDARLREKSYGVAGGMPQAWLDERFIAPPATGDRMNHGDGVAGSETRLDVAVRVYRAMTELLAMNVDELVVVTHGFTASLVVAAWIGMPIEAAGHVAFAAPSGSITTLREDGFFHNRAVITVGDTSHFDELDT